jgi:membrane-associated phospholipid phosphatase
MCLLAGLFLFLAGSRTPGLETGLPGTLAEEESAAERPGDGPELPRGVWPADPLPSFFGFPGSSALFELPPGRQDPDLDFDFEAPHGSFSGFFDTHVSSAAWRDFVWRDYLTQPDVLLPLGLGVAAAVISHWDKRLENHALGIWGSRKDIANGTAGALIGGSLLLGVHFPGPDRNGWDELWSQGEAYGVSSAITSALKFVVWRHRPGGGGRNRSFPSGHATAAFTGAALIELNSGEALGIPAYALAAACGISRMDTGDHFPSDVLAGAAIGVLTAGVFDALHWGTGREGQGIARPPPQLELGVLPEGGMDLGISFGF